MPDDVGVERGQKCGHEPDLGRAEPRADLEDDERCEHGDHDLGDPDGEPRPAERQVDPGEKPSVERLRVRGRDAGQETERPVVDERRGEAVALVDEFLEDRLPLARENQHARRRGHQHDDESGCRASHLDAERGAWRARHGAGSPPPRLARLRACARRARVAGLSCPSPAGTPISGQARRATILLGRWAPRRGNGTRSCPATLSDLSTTRYGRASPCCRKNNRAASP